MFAHIHNHTDRIDVDLHIVGYFYQLGPRISCVVCLSVILEGNLLSYVASGSHYTDSRCFSMRRLCVILCCADIVVGKNNNKYSYK